MVLSWLSLFAPLALAQIDQCSDQNPNGIRNEKVPDNAGNRARPHFDRRSRLPKLPPVGAAVNAEPLRQRDEEGRAEPALSGRPHGVLAVLAEAAHANACRPNATSPTS